MADEVRLIDIIKEFISGDWGEENATEDAPCAVSCVSGYCSHFQSPIREYSRQIHFGFVF